MQEGSNWIVWTEEEAGVLHELCRMLTKFVSADRLSQSQMLPTASREWRRGHLFPFLMRKRILILVSGQRKLIWARFRPGELIKTGRHATLVNFGCKGKPPAAPAGRCFWRDRSCLKLPRVTSQTEAVWRPRRTCRPRAKAPLQDS